MKTISIMIICQAMLLGCSSLDFFQYRENTGLYVVEKPDGYGTTKFGTRISASGDSKEDYMAVSAGQGTSTLIYRLSKDGKLTDVTDFQVNYPEGGTNFISEDALRRGSGAAVAGLPIFAREGSRLTGCMAMGEPGINEVTLWCAAEEENHRITGDSDISNFGQALSAVRLDGGTQFLLAVGGRNGFQVFSDTSAADGRSSVTELSDTNAELKTLAGGRVAADEDGTPGRLFIAAGAADRDTGVHTVYLYLQNRFISSMFVDPVCLTNSKGNGFGGAVVARDLDGDGSDELIVGATQGLNRYDNRVHIFDLPALLAYAADADGCIDVVTDDVPILASIGPDAGDFDVDCDSDCGFGVSLAVGDIALDDEGPELIIGASKADVEGVSEAGAVYVFRDWKRGNKDTYDEVTLAGLVYDSTPEGGKAFGAEVAVAPMAGRNELLISATGEGKVFIAYCTGVGTDINTGADVTKDANGKTVSTRCRL